MGTDNNRQREAYAHVSQRAPSSAGQGLSFPWQISSGRSTPVALRCQGQRRNTRSAGASVVLSRWTGWSPELMAVPPKREPVDFVTGGLRRSTPILISALPPWSQTASVQVFTQTRENISPAEFPLTAVPRTATLHLNAVLGPPSYCYNPKTSRTPLVLSMPTC